MARLARLVVPGLPHHVTQRGNGRARTFFDDDDYALYRDLLAESCRAAGIEVWAWCLMPNHVHLILVPADADGLRRALAATHRRYAGIVHARRKRTGHFWQGRFGSVAMDEAHLAAAVRYVSLNPVRAAGGARPGLALVERARAPLRPGRWAHDGRPGAGARRSGRSSTNPRTPRRWPACARPKASGVRSATRRFSRGSSAPPSGRCAPASAGPSRARGTTRGKDG